MPVIVRNESVWCNAGKMKRGPRPTRSPLRLSINRAATRPRHGPAPPLPPAVAAIVVGRPCCTTGSRVDNGPSPGRSPVRGRCGTAVAAHVFDSSPRASPVEGAWVRCSPSRHTCGRRRAHRRIRRRTARTRRCGPTPDQRPSGRPRAVPRSRALSGNRRRCGLSAQEDRSADCLR
jgi:hypothetical protein